MDENQNEVKLDLKSFVLSKIDKIMPFIQSKFDPMEVLVKKTEFKNSQLCLEIKLKMEDELLKLEQKIKSIDK